MASSGIVNEKCSVVRDLKTFSKSPKQLKRFLTFKISMAYFHMRLWLFFQHFTCAMLAVLLREYLKTLI